MANVPNVSYSITVRLEIHNVPGMLGKVTTAIGKAGGDIGAVDLVGVGKNTIIRDITVKARDEAHSHQIISTLKKIKGVNVVSVSDRVFLYHLGGKIAVVGKNPIKTRDDLSLAYTPGVARVSKAIAEDKEKSFILTIRKNTVAVVSDGTAVLGLGDIGPEAALPVMEGKAQLFKEFANVDAFPIVLRTKDPDEIINTVKLIAGSFGGINLEDISAPRCFYIEDELKKILDIPVFHDDQHGTAIVTLAALVNALKVVKKKMEDIKVVISGAGAAGMSIAKLLIMKKVKDIIVADTTGIIFRGRKEHMNEYKEWLAQHTNKKNIKGKLSDAFEGADVFIGVSGPNIVKPSDLKKMAKLPIVFAMSNPDPEIMPELARKYAKVVATGRSDYPNQINNVLCFPGMFRGVLDVRARQINDDMMLAASDAIASLIKPSDLSEDYIIPSVFDKNVVTAVAKAVGESAYRTGVARKRSKVY
jgi:malate dehydrogenase (oxaloacetate-decarboxylating)